MRFHFLLLLFSFFAFSYSFSFQNISAPNDPDFGMQWGLHNIGQTIPASSDEESKIATQGIDIDILNAWNVTTGSKKVLVAVIDSGIDFSQKDLINNLWTNPKEMYGKAGVDDDSNGYIDDIYGINLINKNSPPTDGNSHGTHVSSIIAAKGDNEIGISGINWDIQIMSIKYLDDQMYALLDNAAEAIYYAVNNGAQIINCSWGSSLPDEKLDNAIKYASEKGVLIIAAAGNDARNLDKYNPEDPNSEGFFPALSNYPNVISVAAMDPNGNITTISNYGNHSVDIAAPGFGIYSWTLKGLHFWQGTSMAAPFVTGVAGLIKSVHPEWKAKEIKDAILNNSRPLKTLRTKVKTGAFLQASAALTMNKPPADSNDPFNWINKPIRIETDHPYVSGKEYSFEIYEPNASKIALHFKRISTFKDEIQIEDSQKKIFKISGLQINDYTQGFTGPKITIKFNPTSGQQMFGFFFDSIAMKP